MTGPRLCTAGRPGAWRASIGSGAGGAGSALATPVTLPNSSVTDEPIATAAVANIVLVDMTPSESGCSGLLGRCRRCRQGSADNGRISGAAGRAAGAAAAAGSAAAGAASAGAAAAAAGAVAVEAEG